MSLSRWSLWLSVLGGVLWLAAAAFLVSVGWGEVSTVTAGSDGAMITETRRTASVWENSPAMAARALLATLVVAAVAVLLIRFGGYLGGALVIGITGLATAAAMLTIGIFIVPGTACMGAAALLALIDRTGSKRRTAL
jgi:hypothetical protein